MARPTKTFHEFVGQTRVVKHLNRLITGAKELGKACPSLFLTAPNGFGKTALAGAIAAEYGSQLHTLLAGQDTRAGDVCETLFALMYGDVFFIDEAHSLGQDAQQVLYVALDEHKAPASNEGRLKRTQFKSIAAFTLVLATNQPGLVRRGLRNRLTSIEFDPYMVLELKAIAERVARKEELELTPQAARLLAETCQGTPRHIERRLEALEVFWPHVHKFGQEHVRELLISEGVDNWGLWPRQRLYLLTLLGSPNGFCSLERLSVKLGCDVVHIRQDVEPYLIDQGLIEIRSGRGRAITAQGRAMANQVKEGEPSITETDLQEAPQC